MMHEHQWVFMGDLLLTYRRTSAVSGEVDHRSEYCISCGTVRVLLSSGTWSELKSDQTKKYLENFEGYEDVVVDDPPEEYRVDRTEKISRAKNQQRLGRGLSDLMQQAQSSGTSIGGLFPDKPEKKN